MTRTYDSSLARTHSGVTGEKRRQSLEGSMCRLPHAAPHPLSLPHRGSGHAEHTFLLATEVQQSACDVSVQIPGESKPRAVVGAGHKGTLCMYPNFRLPERKAGFPRKPHDFCHPCAGTGSHPDQGMEAAPPQPGPGLQAGLPKDTSPRPAGLTLLCVAARKGCHAFSLNSRSGKFISVTMKNVLKTRILYC